MDMIEEIDRHLSEKQMEWLFAISTQSDKTLSETGGLKVVENNMVPALNTKLSKLFLSSLQDELELSSKMFISSIEDVSFQHESEGEGKITTVVALPKSARSELHSNFLDAIFIAVNLVKNPNLVLFVETTGKTSVTQQIDITDCLEVTSTETLLSGLTLASLNFARDMCHSCKLFKNKRPIFSIYLQDRQKPIHFKGDIANLHHGKPVQTELLYMGSVNVPDHEMQTFKFSSLGNEGKSNSLLVSFKGKSEFLIRITEAQGTKNIVKVKLKQTKEEYFKTSTYELISISTAEEEEVQEELQRIAEERGTEPDLFSFNTAEGCVPVYSE